LRDALGFVVAGRDWHPGVVGIVASRLVERHHRPAVVISLDEEGGGRGSGRSIPGFDLLAALEACAEHLEGFGGHKAAAGLQIKAEKVEDFQEAFAAHARSVLGEEDLRRTERVDAMVGGVGLGLELPVGFGVGFALTVALCTGAKLRPITNSSSMRSANSQPASNGRRMDSCGRLRMAGPSPPSRPDHPDRARGSARRPGAARRPDRPGSPGDC